MPFAPIFTHPACALHDPGPRHPEAPSRLEAIRRRLEREQPGVLREAPPAPLEAVAGIHDPRYLDHLMEVAAAGGGRLDADTVMNGASWDAALGGVGAALAALDSALSGVPAFAAGRPPGHHALADRAMGFCLLGTVVAAARRAQALGRRRVLIVDWDVHHGNGTQALVERDPDIRFISMHQWPHWPFSGDSTERGVGNVFNLPMRAGLPPDTYVETLWTTIRQVTTDWSPEVIAISAGFDSMQGDILGGFTLEPEHYATWISRIRTTFPDLPLVAVLEGGYVPARLADGVAAVLTAMA